MLRNFLCVAFLFSATDIFASEPQVIYDSGSAVSTDRYAEILKDVRVPDFGKSWIFGNIQQIQDSPSDPTIWLPLKTTKMTPGFIKEDIHVNYHMDEPVCIVGSDEVSRRWIVRMVEQLKKMNATCWIVQANDIHDYSDIDTLLNGVLLMPAEGDAIADFFHITHYPVIINQRYITQ